MNLTDAAVTVLWERLQNLVTKASQDVADILVRLDERVAGMGLVLGEVKVTSEPGLVTVSISVDEEPDDEPDIAAAA